MSDLRRSIRGCGRSHEKFGKRRVQQDLMLKGVGKQLVAATLETAYEDVDEVALARQYIARKRMKQPSGENAQKETARAMNRLLRAGFSSRAIYKVLREWELPEECGGRAGGRRVLEELRSGRGIRMVMRGRMRRMIELLSCRTGRLHCDDAGGVTS